MSARQQGRNALATRHFSPIGRFGRLAAAVALAISLCAIKPLAADDGPAAIEWLSGQACQQKLAEPITMSWSAVPLRSAVQGLSVAQRVAVLIDRRIDPDQKLDLALADVLLAEALERTASGAGGRTAQLGAVVYLGPTAIAAKLRTLAALRAQDASRLTPAARRRFSQRAALAWDDLTTPREILAGIAAREGVALTGLEQVPHDLWAAADLPPLSTVERLTLVAAQFDLTFEIAPDGSAARLVELPREILLRRSYPGGRDPAAMARKWAHIAPQAEIRVEGPRLIVRAVLEVHERLNGAKPTKRSPPTAPNAIERTRIDKLSLQQLPVAQVLDELARRLGLKIEYDRRALEQAGISPDQRITVNVEKVTIDELLEAVLKPIGLDFRRNGKTVVVEPAPAGP